jgi:stage II sporulation protein D
MERVRIGIMHHRQEITLRLPHGTAVGREPRAVLRGGLWTARARIDCPGIIWTGLKILESADEELIAAVADLLGRAGLDVLDNPHAPGARWSGGLYAPATRLLLVPAARESSAGRDHVSREGVLPADEAILEKARQATARLREERKPEIPPSLWHVDKGQRHTLLADEPLGTIILTGPCGESHELESGARLILPDDTEAFVQDVRVGIGFHWDHHEELAYPDTLCLHLEADGRLCLVNELDLEEYLAGVNSSEMKADNPPDLLRAQTAAARSTLLSTRGRHHASEPFDLCADDHCQCYRGTGVMRPESLAAVRDTEGLVIAWEGMICDARYSKSCGGVTESWEHVWEDQPVPWTPVLRDSLNGLSLPEPKSEAEWREYILADEDVCCNTERHSLPASMEYCEGMYRWTLSLPREEVASQIRTVSGESFEVLFDLEVVRRGRSGRIERLNVVTDRGVFELGKELVIRRALWKNCLYSSAFFLEFSGPDIVITGKGWGHGVGLCQLGALHMASVGISWQDILAHYYPGTSLEQIDAAGGKDLDG